MPVSFEEMKNEIGSEKILTDPESGLPFVYVGAGKIPKVLGDLGVNILTTPRGVMSGKSARKGGVGGEILCSVT